MSHIQSIIKNIQNIMRKDAGVDGDAQRLSQLVWMLCLPPTCPQKLLRRRGSF